MALHIQISEGDRLLLSELLNILGLTQKALAGSAEVTQPWLSQVLKGQRKRIDSEMIERVARVLVEGLKNRKGDSGLLEDRIRVSLTSLGRFTAAAAASIPPKIYPPGGLVPVDAGHYIKRPADDQILEALQSMPFTMLVRGPVQCGKSSLLARLEHKVREIGIETAWFAPRVPISPPQRTKQEPDVNVRTAMALSELLQADWGLEPPRDGTIDSIPGVVNWLSKALALTASNHRLLIMDDLASLGAGAAEDWLSLFVRAMHNKRATGGAQVSIAVGVTHHFGVYFSRRLLNLSSIVHWGPSIDLDWLKNTEVEELGRAITGTPPNANDLYDLFAGQPYLTHATITDAHFRESMRRWIDEPSDVNALAIRKSHAYEQHLNAIRLAILGPTLEADSVTGKLLQSFVDACSGQVPDDLDHKRFLETARLLNEAGKPTSAIYCLIAGDLLKSLRR